MTADTKRAKEVEQGVDAAVNDGNHFDDADKLEPVDLAAILERLESRVAEGMAELLDRFDKKLAYDGFKEEQISRLHAELQEHKRDLLGRALRPLILGILRLHGDLERIVAALRRQGAAAQTPERFFATLDGFRDDLELLLEHHGVEPFKVPGESFDPKRQTAIRTAPCASREQTGQVVERLHPGFAAGGDTLVREKVVVAVFAEDRRAAAAPAETPMETPEISTEGDEP